MASVCDSVKHPEFYLWPAASGECCANNSFNFGIQIAAGLIIIGCRRLCGRRASRPWELDREVADDLTKHQLSHQNGGAGDFPGIGIGRVRLDVSLEATPRTGPNKHDTVLCRASSCRRVRRTLLLSTIGGRKRGDVFQHHSWRESSQAVYHPEIGGPMLGLCARRKRGCNRRTYQRARNSAVRCLVTGQPLIALTCYPAAATAGFATLTASLP